MHIALVAGELSGDLLGASLIAALKARYPQARFTGIGGPEMIAQGLLSLVSLERLAVMGLVEVLHHLPALFRIRQQLYQQLIADRPDVFIGIDAPDFNLGLERQLRVHGIPAVHYVSPSVWAWRPWRVRKIARAVDLVLTLFPFEAAFYEQYSVPVSYVGHPLADEIPLYSDARKARQQLSLALPAETRIIALLPGSRRGEVSRLAPLFLDTAQWLYAQWPNVHFLIPAAAPQLYAFLEALRSKYAPGLPLTLIQGHSREVMTAADIVLLASGTATLEAMLLKRPMVVAYRVAPITAWLARRLVTTRYFALPNLLAGRELVPEFLQDAATVPHLGAAVLRWLSDTAASEKLVAKFTELHVQLRRNASEQAATAIMALLRPLSKVQ
ncbi:MAG TPA: lipid-A-disaccharide synthase [Candidatus Competibacteraceae bacterium]|nr:lipid-A-disaccharide synthase [Candidatus Competibacteraceae bacterium]MCP5133079.1 lipid-A-disaccharide synthase [Gammaproteobacteria bacterium]HPF57366.1 lipid-A-disaccharide synthase [Candidatus Competibacteraceae bacterium]HRY17288.1 lipid-A-disaccharide synthase [Candidatus Competibacteraceae bacterium]